jgi:hypothetical protein
MISREQRDRLKSVLIRYPALFRAVRASYITFARVQREAFALFHFAPQLSGWSASQNETAWRSALPVQQPLRVDASAITPTLNPEQVKAWCRARGLAFFEGPDAVYLPPESWHATPLAPVLPHYPADAGLKIVQHAGDTETKNSIGRLHSSHRLQSLTFNYLHLQGLAPRLYDLIEIRDGTRVIWTAYVVRHVTSTPLQANDCQALVADLHWLAQEGPLRLADGVKWADTDFRPPACNGKILRDAENGRPIYLDANNFILESYGRYLRDLALNVKEFSHFGARSRLLGGKSGAFLYQEFPGLDQPAKRSPRARLQAWDPLLARAGLSIEGKTVFDVGCNLGLMGAEYLRRGVRWVHGWDRPEVTDAAYKVLLSIGCTRFSLSGGMLGPDTDLFAQLPDHLKPVGHDNAILSYLSVRDHVGWLPGIASLPWRYMLYEGHPDDREIESYVADLNARIPVRLLTTDRVSDGVVATHDIALIERLSFN